MLLRGHTKNLKRTMRFTIGDCPVFIESDLVALVAISGSSLIAADTIVRGDDESLYFEGDMVYSGDEFVGYIIYSQGFKVQLSDGTLKLLSEVEHIKVKDGTVDSILKVRESKLRTPLLFKACNSIFQMHVLLAKLSSGKLAVSGDSVKSSILEPSQVLFSTGIISKDTNELIFFGEMYKCGTVILHNGVPCIKVGEEYEEVKGD